MSQVEKETRILLVDDEADFVLSMSKALGRRGFDVSSAPDGRSALEMLAADSFDVIVLDVKMPGLDGDAVFREIRRMQIHSPVVMLTGHGNVQQAFELSKEGVFEYLAKPCEVEEFSEVLRRAASAHSSHSDSTPQDVPTRVLLAVDDKATPPRTRERFERGLSDRGLDVVVATRAQESFDLLRSGLFDVVVLALEDITAVVTLKTAYPLVEVLAFVPRDAGVLASQLIKNGAFDVLDATVSVEGLAERIRAAHDRRRGRLEQERLLRIRDILARQPD